MIEFLGIVFSDLHCGKKMKKAIRVTALSFLICCTAASAEGNSGAGIGIRMTVKEQSDSEFRKLILANELIDCVYLGVCWASVEPEEGKFDFSQLRREVTDWTSTGKHVVIQMTLYGQAVDDSITPAWIYEKKNVRAVHFSGGGVARGREVRVPAVWQKGFASEYVLPLVRAMAKEFDGDKRISYVHPGFGHLGHVTAQPSKFGGPAFVSAGWTPKKWTEYCRETSDLYRSSFKKTPLMFSSSPKLITDKAHAGYSKDALRICTDLAQPGDSVLFLGVHADPEVMFDVGETASEYSSQVAGKNIPIGMGDDWPLWVPESRRGDGPTRGEDEKFLSRALGNCFQFQKKSIQTSFLYLNPPEALASLQIDPDKLPNKYKIYGFDKGVRTIIEEARKQLLENDPSRKISIKKQRKE